MATATQLKKYFQLFNTMKVAVIGDVMLDKYLFGTAERISPEAPVPVVDVHHATARPGGAANVAMNIKAMGATPYLFSVIGNDHDGLLLQDLLEEAEISCKYVHKADERITTSKMRIMAKQHQMLRIDHELTDALSDETAAQFDNQLMRFLRTQKPDVVILEDYDKGVLSQLRSLAIIDLCNSLEIPVAVDPKKTNFFGYSGCTLFKPNLRELRESLNGAPISTDTQALNAAVKELQSRLAHQITLLTLGESGMYLRHHAKSYRTKAHLRDIADVSGAGDTVISVASLCLAAGMDARTMLEISNLAGGQVCEHAGVVPVSKETLLKEAIALLS